MDKKQLYRFCPKFIKAPFFHAFCTAHSFFINAEVINKLIHDVYPDSKEIGMFDIGSMIGVMERILTVIFACFDNFPAIAIIITVKTWARTNDLKQTEFRNKYLLGTLSSLVLALLVFLIYKSI